MANPFFIKVDLEAHTGSVLENNRGKLKYEMCDDALGLGGAHRKEQRGL